MHSGRIGEIYPILYRRGPEIKANSRIFKESIINRFIDSGPASLLPQIITIDLSWAFFQSTDNHSTKATV